MARTMGVEEAAIRSLLISMPVPIARCQRARAGAYVAALYMAALGMQGMARRRAASLRSDAWVGAVTPDQVRRRGRRTGTMPCACDRREGYGTACCLTTAGLSSRPRPGRSGYG